MIASVPNADQERFWDVEAGPTWVRNMAAMDACFAPVLDAVLTGAALRSGEDVLDIGCGAGTSTGAAARRVGPSGSALGADISQTLLAHATGHRNNARFVYADAQTYPFEEKSIDVLMSRFGVMFFADPQAAFRNMGAALRPGGRMIFAAWGQIDQNPFFTLPARVSRDMFGPMPKSDPDGPGPFSFRDTDKVCALLRRSGFQDVAVDVQQMMLTPAGGAAAYADVMLQIGPAANALHHFEASTAQMAQLRAALIEAVGEYHTEACMRIPAQINLFSARWR